VIRESIDDWSNAQLEEGCKLSIEHLQKTQTIVSKTFVINAKGGERGVSVVAINEKGEIVGRYWCCHWCHYVDIVIVVITITRATVTVKSNQLKLQWRVSNNKQAAKEY